MVCTGTAPAMAATSARHVSRSSARSALLSTITGRGAAFPRHREIAFEAADVEVAIEAGDEEGDVHVRREDLLRRLLAGDLAREDAGARQDATGWSRVRWRDGHRTPTQSPTAGRSRRDCASCRMRPVHVGERFVVFEVHAKRRAVGHRHAPAAGLPRVTARRAPAPAPSTRARPDSSLPLTVDRSPLTGSVQPPAAPPPAVRPQLTSPASAYRDRSD